MSFRKLILSAKMWCRLRRAKKEILRLKAQLREAKDDLEDLEITRRLDETALIEKYERLLTSERVKIDLLYREWANRFLQLQGLSPLGVTNSLVEEQVDHILIPDKASDPQLSPAQVEELHIRKQKFYDDGVELGVSVDEINLRWKQMEPEIISDVRMAIL